jgi:cytokinesis protein
MACQGQVVLANYLNGLNHRRGRGGVDVEVELELLRCLKRSLGNKVGILPNPGFDARSRPQMGTLDAVQKPQIVFAIASSLISPHMACRKVAGEILVFFCHWDEQNPERVGLRLVLRGFEIVEQQLNTAVTDLAHKVGRFDVWLRQLEAAIDGRGRMGSAVGVSKDLKGQDDGSILDYCVSFAPFGSHS